MAWPVPLPEATGDEAADLAAFAAWEQAIERHYHPDRFGPDGQRLPQPRPFDYYLGIPEPSWLGKLDKGPDGAYRCVGLPKFVSAARLARYRTDGDRWPVSSTCTYAIDSGAYIALSGTNRDVPWFADSDEYGGMILRFMDNNGYWPDFVAPQDWPCEPTVRAKTGFTVRQHQELTRDSYVWLVREFPMVPWIPVLQGWEPEDYQTHKRMYEDAGVDLAAAIRVGVGSICRRGHLPGIVEVIEQFADAGYRMHGFGIKTTALPVIGHLLRSADSMAWSTNARKNHTKLPGCTHVGDCRNCYRYAVRWRERVLAAMSRPEEATVPAAPHRLEMRFPAQLRVDDVFMVGDSGPFTYVSDTVKPSNPKIARITVREQSEVIELDAFDKTPAVRMISRGSVDPIFGDGMRGEKHLFVPLTRDPDRCGECGDGQTPNHIFLTMDEDLQLTANDLLALRGYAENRRADLTATELSEARCSLTAAGLARECPRSESPMYVAATDEGRALLAKLDRNAAAEPAKATAEPGPAGQDDLFAGVFELASLVADNLGKTPAKKTPPRQRTAKKTAAPGQADLIALLDLTASIADQAAAGSAAPAGVIPLTEVTWGMYGTVTGGWGPDGSVSRKLTGYVTRLPRIYTSGIMGHNKGPKKAGEPLLHVTLEHAPNGSSADVYCLPDTTFTIEEPPAEHATVKAEMRLSCRLPFADLRPGDVFYIWDQRDGFRDLLHHGGWNVADLRTRYHVQSTPRKAGETAFQVEVLVDGEGPAEPMMRAGSMWVDVADPREEPWHDAASDDRPNPIVRARRALADRLGPDYTVLVDPDGVVAVTGEVYEDTVVECVGRPYRWWLTHDKGVDLFRPRDGEQFGPIGGYVGAAGDGYDEVRQVLAESVYEYRGIELPRRDLGRELWEKTHAVLRGMGATGGSRKREPYALKESRLPDLWAFIAGEGAPQHERTTAGWVRTPDKLAADVVARFAETKRLPQLARVLEPSAGDGSLITAVLAALPKAELVAVEPDEERVRKLANWDPTGKWRFGIHTCTFEEYVEQVAKTGAGWQPDLVVMNPPYSTPGNRGLWANHVRLAWEHLAEGGRLVAILPGDLSRPDIRMDQVLKLVGEDRQTEQLPKRSFRQPGKGGTDIDTWVLAATKPVSGTEQARKLYEASLYRPAEGEPARVAELRLNRADAQATPVQTCRDWGGDFVVRYVGWCVVCTVSCWGRDDGNNDPRGMLGYNAVAPLRADEIGMAGPDVCLCWQCNDSGIMRTRGEARARTMWTTPEPEPLTFTSVCPDCGAQTEPIPAEGPGESWKSAEQWAYLAMQDHKPHCRGRAAAAEDMTAVAVGVGLAAMLDQSC